MKAELGINRITPSMLVEYENCPKLFYFRSWLGLKMPTPMMHLQFGTAIHAAIDEIYAQQPNWNSGDLNIALDKFKELFKLENVDDKEYTDVERSVKFHEMIADGVEMLTQFWAQKEILWAAGVQPKIMELPLKMKVFSPQSKEELEVPFSCRLDGECENSNIIEFKTSSAPYDNFETHLSNQARSYVWVQYCRTGKIPQVHYVVLLKKRKRDKIQHLHLQFDEGDILAFESKVKSMLERIRNREFGRPARFHPPYCDCYKYEKLLRKHESTNSSIPKEGPTIKVR